MIAGGIGGANTLTGKWFEVATDLKTALIEAKYNLNDFIFCRQHDFPKYFKEKTGLKMEDIFGKKFLPDEAVIYNDVLYVVEKRSKAEEGLLMKKFKLVHINYPFIKAVQNYQA